MLSVTLQGGGGGAGNGDVLHPVSVSVQLGGDEEEEEEEEEGDVEDGEPGGGGEPELPGEGVAQPSASEVAGREGEGGVAEGGANQEGVVQMQHLMPVEDAERLSSSSPSSLFRLDWTA